MESVQQWGSIYPTEKNTKRLLLRSTNIARPLCSRHPKNRVILSAAESLYQSSTNQSDPTADDLPLAERIQIRRLHPPEAYCRLLQQTQLKH